MTTLPERYRPQKFRDVVGQEDAMSQLRCLLKTTGLAGQAIALIGESGTGKTTIARLIAAKVAGEAINCEEMDALDVTLDLLRKLEKEYSRKPLFGDGYCFIINEAHNLGSKNISRLLTIMDEPAVQRNTTFVFTMTTDGQERLFGSKFDALPFMSRCVTINLAFDEGYKQAAAERAKEVAEENEVGGAPLGEYLQLFEECNGNMRAMLNQVSQGMMAR